MSARRRTPYFPDAPGAAPSTIAPPHPAPCARSSRHASLKARPAPPPADTTIPRTTACAVAIAIAGEMPPVRRSARALAAFLPPLPLRLPAPAAPRRARWRASAVDEPPSGGGGGGGGSDAMRRQRSELERMLGLELKSAEGHGQCDCIWCGGSGGRTCTWCRGNGFREERINKSWTELQLDIEKKQRGEPVEMPAKVPVECVACRGSKVLTCRFCRGSGRGSYGFAY